VPFAPIKRLRIAEQVAEHIRDAILGGNYSPGDPLPSERDMADQFGVNRSSVREALHRLEAWGLVEMRQGGATRVRDFLVTAGVQLLPYLLAPGGELDPKMLRDLLEIRTMLLGWTARMAAERATPDQVERLQELLAALESASDAEQTRLRDYDFYDHLVGMTGNAVLVLFSSATRRVFTVRGELFAGIFEGFDVSFHRQATAAIAAGDAEAAASAMAAYGARAEAAVEAA
jgi:DNA-binding FadR family transcriptional regulator